MYKLYGWDCWPVQVRETLSALRPCCVDTCLLTFADAGHGGIGQCSAGGHNASTLNALVLLFLPQFPDRGVSAEGAYGLSLRVLQREVLRCPRPSHTPRSSANLPVHGWMLWPCKRPLTHLDPLSEPIPFPRSRPCPWLGSALALRLCGRSTKLLLQGFPTPG